MVAWPEIRDAAREVELSKAIEAGLYAEYLLDSGEERRGVSREELERLVTEGQRAKDLFIRANLLWVALLVVALTLDLLGVPRQAIAGDYATAPPPTTTSALPELAHPTPETILRVLAHLDTRYGGTARYLMQSGATSSQLTSLTSRFRS